MRLSPSIALLRTQPDERLVKLAREGSEAAFAAIVERYRKQVLRACGRILPEARAEDAAQQAFMSAWTALARGDEVLDVQPWLVKIARNTSLNALRVRGYDYDQLQDSLRVGEAPQAELERRDVVRQTLAGLAALPERQREALLRSAVAGVSHAEIARDLGLSEGATRQLVLRARTAMRSAVSALVPTPLITWAAAAAPRSGSGEITTRIAEIAAGGGAAGGALLAKAGAVAVVAGTAIAGPAVVHHQSRHQEAAAASRPAAVAAAEAKAHPAATETATAAPAKLKPAVAKHRSTRYGKGHGADDAAERRHRGSDEAQHHEAETETETHHHSGSGSGGSDDSVSSGSGSGGSGSDDSLSSGSGSSGSGSDDSISSGSSSDDSLSSGSGSSGSGSDDSLPSGSGSDSSGSGSNDSLSSGSGSDDSLSSGSGSDSLSGSGEHASDD